MVWADSWDFRVGFNAREGLILHDVRFLEHPPQPQLNPHLTSISSSTSFSTSSSTSVSPSSTSQCHKRKPELITRHLFFRASMCEMTVPYGDPRPQHYRKNAFDAGEYLLLFYLIILLSPPLSPFPSPFPFSLFIYGFDNHHVWHGTMCELPQTRMRLQRAYTLLRCSYMWYDPSPLPSSFFLLPLHPPSLPLLLSSTSLLTFICRLEG